MFSTTCRGSNESDPEVAPVPHRAEFDRCKRQLLTGLVEENVEALHGRPRGSLRRERAARLARRRRLATSLAVVVVAGVAVGALMWPGRDASAIAERAPAQLLRTSLPEAVDTDGPAMESPHELLSSAIGRGLPGEIPLLVRRVAIDAGHGGLDSGTSLTHGLLEKDLTLDIARRFAECLRQSGITPVLTRQDDTEVMLRRRAEIANAARADLFVSIHVNWLPDRTARGVEIYHLGPTNDPFLQRLAAIENRESGFALADYRELLEGLYADVRQRESRRLAREIQRSLASTLRQENPDIISRGVMTAPFAVLIATEMPAVLAEVACLSNDQEARLLALTSYRQRIAEALREGVVHYMESVGSPQLTASKGQ